MFPQCPTAPWNPGQRQSGRPRERGSSAHGPWPIDHIQPSQSRIPKVRPSVIYQYARNATSKTRSPNTGFNGVPTHPPTTPLSSLLWALGQTEASQADPPVGCPRAPSRTNQSPPDDSLAFMLPGLFKQDGLSLKQASKRIQTVSPPFPTSAAIDAIN